MSGHTRAIRSTSRIRTPLHRKPLLPTRRSRRRWAGGRDFLLRPLLGTVTRYRRASSRNRLLTRFTGACRNTQRRSQRLLQRPRDERRQRLPQPIRLLLHSKDKIRSKPVSPSNPHHVLHCTSCETQKALAEKPQTPTQIEKQSRKGTRTPLPLAGPMNTEDLRPLMAWWHALTAALAGSLVCLLPNLHHMRVNPSRIYGP